MADHLTNPTSQYVDPLRLRARLGRHRWDAPVPFAPLADRSEDGWLFRHHPGDGQIIVTTAPDRMPGGDVADWIHASICWHHQMPTYQDLKDLHQAVYGDGWAYQVFAPPAEHVNITSHALHLFGRADGRPALPDFTHGTRSI